MKFRASNQNSAGLQNFYFDQQLLTFDINNNHELKEETMAKSKNAPPPTPTNGETPSTGLNHVSGLNNLGNTCFFNATLQNLAQTPHLEFLLHQNQLTVQSNFRIEHNADFDSDLTDYEDDEPVTRFTENSKNVANESLVSSEGDHDEADEDKDSSLVENMVTSPKSSNRNEVEEDEKMTLSPSSATNNISFNSTKSSNDSESSSQERQHRSIRVKDVDLQFSLPPSQLGKQLLDAIKSMTSSNGHTINPSSLFSQLGKKVPHFKGYHQQDSHELLRSLLDAIKTDELKRRQGAILEHLRIPVNEKNPKNVDEKSRKILKRYGRLASYTLVDRLFGGHLLSSVVCDQCKTCTQRVEPFLDLSLPIIDEATLSKAALASQAYTSKHKKNSRGANVSKAQIVETTETPKKTTNGTNANFYEKKEEQMSKHLTKKQKKANLKKKTKATKKASKNKDDQSDEEDDEKDAKPEESNLPEPETCQIEKNEPKQPDTPENNTDEISVEVGVKEESVEVEAASPSIEEDEDTTDISNLERCSLDDHIDEKEDASNTYRLDAMKTIVSGSGSGSESNDCTTIESCLSKFTAKEILSDRFSCQKCTSRFNNKNQNPLKFRSNVSNSNSKPPSVVYTQAQKQYLICELPCVLTIHLKRFQQYGFRFEKSNKHVQFPLELDMSPFTSQMCVNLNKTTANPSLRYSLYGLIEHSGRLNSGHYTAYVRKTPGSQSEQQQRQRTFLGNQRICQLRAKVDATTPTTTTNDNQEASGDSYQATDKWFHISDSKVTEVDVKKVLSAQAYILFYERFY